jgi:thiol-disulfide isomerase/thioredoxin
MIFNMAAPNSTFRKTLLKALLPIALILVLVVGGLSLLKKRMSGSSHEGNKAFIQVGETVPDFNLTPYPSGETLPISEHKAKVFMINFWATWCTACVVEMPSIVALRNAYANQGFEVLPINVDENPGAVIPAAIEKFKFTFPVYTDPKNMLAELFDVHAIPLTVFLDKNRKILFVESGERDWNGKDIRKQLEIWLGAVQ